MKENSVFAALSDPSRRIILSLLKERDRTPGEMMPHVAMTKPSLSHHLAILKKADLVSTIRRGQNIIYSLNTSVMDEVLTFIVEFMQKGVKNEKLQRPI
jgi:ArsR family transcriptional regulator, arsenate/arsenite/antimonite-responsive transcriptional repressor